MKSLSIFSAALVAGAMVAAPVANAQAPESEDEKTTYAIGFLLGEALTPFRLSETELKMVIAGLSDRVQGKTPLVSPQEYQPQVQELRNKRVAAVIEEEKAASEQALADASAAEGAITTDSGLIYRELQGGAGRCQRLRTPCVCTIAAACATGPSSTVPTTVVSLRPSPSTG